MGMFRSEAMQHGTLVLPADRARDFIELLGAKTHIQFVDMNAHSMKRQYKRYLQRIEEMERILRFLTDEIKKLPGTTIIEADVDAFLETDHGYQLDVVEETLQKLYHQFQKFQENNVDLLLQKNNAIEEHAVARAALKSLEASTGRQSFDRPTRAEEVEAGGVGTMGFTSVAGVISTDEQEKFARTVFRATRGNAFTHFEPVPEALVDAKTGKAVPRSVFVTYFQSGAGSSALASKISRICTAFGVRQHEWPRSISDASAKARSLEQVIADKSHTLAAYEEFFATETAALLEVHRPHGGSLLDDYHLFCLKEKSIYATLNLFEGAEATLRADCWLPLFEEEDVRRLLMQHGAQNQASAFLLTDRSKPKKSPPTYIRTTEFTAVFQSFVDTYGVPRYQEANPALLTIMTFPFLFGIMYGDIGHGACVLAFGIFLTVMWSKLKTSKDEMVQMVAGGRYMILLMGIFAVYAGFLYNDFFSLGLDMFGTRFVEVGRDDRQVTYRFDTNRNPYPFGFDPIWKGATNELLFMNSFKMKFAVTVGFFHMTTGIFMKCLNCLHFKDNLTLVFEFIPQLIFMTSLVGYMIFLIFLKWATPERLINGRSNKPLIITSIIDMCMLRTPELVAFKSQGLVQKILLVLMLVSVPVMLLPKPLLRRHYHKKAHAERRLKNAGIEGGLALAHDEDEEFDFGEEMIHQMIETIEFVLGAISNTASYLRLWALSLAHQQLALVLFNMTIGMVLNLNMNAYVVGVLLFFVFAAFAAFTFGIMICMDSLECFLHALRLQWVEFQNKFYKADGYAFTPFSFKTTLTQVEEK